MKAVITADLIDSTKLTKDDSEKVMKTLYMLQKELMMSRVNYAQDFYIKRGDNVQIELTNVSDALRVALLLKTTLNKISLNPTQKKNIQVDARIAIGIGEIDNIRENVNESSGEAYMYSGRTVDMMKKSKRHLFLTSGESSLNDELYVELLLLEEILSNWKRSSAEVVNFLLLGFNEFEIAEKLGITQPAVNQRKKTAGWIGIQALLERFENLLIQYK